MRIDYAPESLGAGAFYRLLTSVVVPRPIAWVSTLAADGTTANLAPHSFFTVACTDPPIVQFTSVGRKDSLRNIEATGEFVVNLAPEPLFEQINASAVDFPAEVDEFDAVGIEREPSLVVGPPRVAASPVALECRLHSTLGIGRARRRARGRRRRRPARHPPAAATVPARRQRVGHRRRGPRTRPHPLPRLAYVLTPRPDTAS
jgi:flavin reductase (DIM6/NTAB) family NADH-FMN oxidoreductase RutF